MQFYELARKEIGALILSDEHPNIVRCFAMEEDSEFVYLALERCKQSLADLVTGDGGSVFLVDEAKHPTPFCIQVRSPRRALQCVGRNLSLPLVPVLKEVRWGLTICVPLGQQRCCSSPVAGSCSQSLPALIASGSQTMPGLAQSQQTRMSSATAKWWCSLVALLMCHCWGCS